MKVTRKRFYLKEFLPFDLVGVLLSGPQSLQRILLQKLHTDTDTAAVGFFSGRGVQLGQLDWFLPEALNIEMTWMAVNLHRHSSVFSLLQLSIVPATVTLKAYSILFLFYDHL